MLVETADRAPFQLYTYELLHAAATIIQASYRGYIVRKHLWSVHEEYKFLAHILDNSEETRVEANPFFIGRGYLMTKEGEFLNDGKWWKRPTRFINCPRSPAPWNYSNDLIKEVDTVTDETEKDCMNGADETENVVNPVRFDKDETISSRSLSLVDVVDVKTERVLGLLPLEEIPSPIDSAPSTVPFKEGVYGSEAPIGTKRYYANEPKVDAEFFPPCSSDLAHEADSGDSTASSVPPPNIHYDTDRGDIQDTMTVATRDVHESVEMPRMDGEHEGGSLKDISESIVNDHNKASVQATEANQADCQKKIPHEAIERATTCIVSPLDESGGRDELVPPSTFSTTVLSSSKTSFHGEPTERQTEQRLALYRNVPNSGIAFSNQYIESRLQELYLRRKQLQLEILWTRQGIQSRMQYLRVVQKIF